MLIAFSFAQRRVKIMEKKRILIVDDEIGFTHLLKLNLEGTGLYEIRVENNGTNGLAAAAEFHPDLILLDVIMPDLDGGEVASRLSADPKLKKIPIVFITAVVSKEETDARGGVIGSYPFIAKPVNLETVKALINKHMPR